MYLIEKINCEINFLQLKKNELKNDLIHLNF